jgi:hypothetical protein
MPGGPRWAFAHTPGAPGGPPAPVRAARGR